MTFTTTTESNTPAMLDLNDVVAAPVKKRGRPKKSATKTATHELHEVSEIENLKTQLLNMSQHNPEVVTKPINNEVQLLVDDMSLSELKARIRAGNFMASTKLDNVVASQAIALTNQVAGRFLGCLEELNESTARDELLQEATTELLSVNVLSLIPTELKVMGLYSSHVGSAMYVRSLKNPKPSENPNITQDIEIPEPEKLGTEFNEDSLTELRDKLVAFKGTLP